MGTVTLSNNSKVSKIIFGLKLKKNNVNYKLHSISNSAKEAVKEATIMKLRGYKTVTKTYLVHVTYASPKKNVHQQIKINKKDKKKRKYKKKFPTARDAN